MLDTEFGERAQSCDLVSDLPLLSGWTQDLQIVEHHVQRSQARGVEVRVDLGQIFQAKPFHRSGIDARHWRWRHVLGRKVVKRSHFKVLELRAIGLTIKWRLRARPRTGRVLHLS